MRFLFYTHSLVSDWNHGNAHFLRGVMRELVARGHDALALEPEDGWSRTNLEADQGPAAAARFATDFPELRPAPTAPVSTTPRPSPKPSVAVVHEWTDPALVAASAASAAPAALRASLPRHHHRAVSDNEAIGALALEDYDAVLAFGATLRERYAARGWGDRAITWHEAADARLFRPHPEIEPTHDLIWIGNWGDGERSRELAEFLIDPPAASASPGRPRRPLPARALAALARPASPTAAGSPTPTRRAPSPPTASPSTSPRAYVRSLPGIPTIRVFEAPGCGDTPDLRSPGKTTKPLPPRP
jgi:spore maturation protein CgeB